MPDRPLIAPELRDAFMELYMYDREAPEKEFYDKVLAVFAGLIDLELATLWFRHRDESPMEDFLVIRSVFTDKSAVKKFVERAENLVLLAKGDKGIIREAVEMMFAVPVPDFTKEKRFLWQELAGLLNGRSVIALPLLDRSRDFAYGGIVLHPAREAPKEDLKKRLVDAAELLSPAIQRFLISVREVAKERFRKKVPTLVGKFGNEFYATFLSIVRDFLPSHANVRLLLRAAASTEFYDFEEREQTVKKGLSSKEATFANRLATAVCPDDPIEALLDYAVVDRKADPECKLEVSLGAQIRDFSHDAHPVVGVIYCSQEVRSFDEAARVFIDDDREYLRYVGLVASAFVGNLAIATRARTLTTRLGHEIVKPFAYVVNSVRLMNYYHVRKREEYYVKHYADIEDYFNFILDYTMNVVKYAQSLTLVDERFVDFQVDVLRPLLKYLSEVAAIDREIKIDCSGSFPRKYTMDRNLMREALFNVIHNAIKYSYVHGQNVQVTGVYKPGEWWEIKVRDWGIGIPPEEAYKVFREFVCCSNARAHDANGLGLGCFLASRIIALHGGKLSITNFVKPTEVTVRLPYTR